MSTIVQRIKEWRARAKIIEFVRRLERSPVGTIVSIKEDPEEDETLYVFQHFVLASPQIFYGFRFCTLQEARDAVAQNDFANCTFDQMFWYWPDIADDAAAMRAAQGRQLIENYEHLRITDIAKCFRIVETPQTHVPVDVYVELPLKFVDLAIQENVSVFQDYMDQGFGEIADRTTLKEWYNEDDGSFRGEDLLINKIDFIALRKKMQ